MQQQFENKVDLTFHLNARMVVFDFLMTMIICALIAVALTMAGPGKDFLHAFVISESFGIAVCTMVLLLLRVVKPQRWLSLVFVILAAVCAGVFFGLQAGVFILEHFFNVTLNWPVDILLKTMVVGVIFSIGFLYFFMTNSRLKHRREQIEQEKTKTVALQKEALEANLRMLQAQIEPHFLFNTLSNVISLIDTDPVRGKAMLLDLTKYLRTSLSRTLPEKTTLAQEMDMIQAYLNIQKIRMGDRLNFVLDVPDGVRGLYFPPMLLQPLVENAVKHGLEPKIEGGEITVQAIRESDLLKVEVVDTGLGFSSLNSSGVGMANVRERLNLLFGDKAKFVVEENSPSGVKAIIEVPVHD